MTKPTEDRPIDDDAKELDLEAARLEIAYHQLTFWRFFAWMKTALQKTLIWGIFFAILYALKDFFPLIFLTFMLSFISASVVRVIGKRFPALGWKTRVVFVFLLLIAVMTGMIQLLIPQVKFGVYNMKVAAEEFPTKWTNEIEPKLIKESELYRKVLGIDENGEPMTAESKPAAVDAAAESLPAIERRQLSDLAEVRHFIDETKSAVLKKIPDYLQNVVTGVSALFMLLFLSTLFSFLIVLDLDGLRREVMKLDETKLKGFYRETMLNIVKFGAVLGKVIEAQAVIALVNTALTAIGLYFFGIPHIAFLCLGVFICGFIPVAGVFISSVPICLVALFTDGPSMFLWMIVFITVIHMIEAYILNPRIMGATLHVNPVLVLMILVIGHKPMGVWGFLLGVPLCYYFFTYVIKKEDREIGLRVRLAKRKTTAVTSSNPLTSPPTTKPPGNAAG